MIPIRETFPTREEAEANARLIAAAPVMLAALKEIASGCTNRRPDHVYYFKTRTRAEIEAIALAAIAEAEGHGPPDGGE